METPVRSFLCRLALFASGLLLAAGSARAGVIIQPSTVTSSTAGTDFYPAVNLINGSGLSGTPMLTSLGSHADSSNTTTWVTQASAPDYYATLPAPVLTFTLPAPARLVSELAIWGYPIGGTANKNEARTFSVTFSTDGTNFGSAAVVTQPAILGPNGARLAFPGAARLATHVRVTITDNFYDGTLGGGDRVGLGEVRFIEPSTLTVLNTNDTGAGSLRQAVLDAAAGDSIVFAAGLNGGTINLGSEIVLNRSLTIDASALSLGLTISDGAAITYRLFNMTGGNVTLRGLTLANGGGSGFSDLGGAISNTGATLVLTRCTFTGNSAVFGGAIFSSTALLTGSPTSSTTLTQCTLSGNTATLGGGAIRNSDGRTTLTHCTVSGNTAPAGQGSGVSSYGDSETGTAVQNSIISGNTGSSVDLVLVGTNSFTSRGSNLIGSGNATGNFNQPGDLLNNTPLLAAPGNYSGPLKTRPPLSGSPAVNAALGFPGATDQRGLAIGTYVYENDFALGSLKGATVLTSGGNALTGTIDAGSFRLTPPALNQYVSLLLPVPGAFTTFAASFDLSYTDGTGSGFGGPADGMSFSFGPAPGGAVGENGVPGAHVVSFNTHNGDHATDGLLRYINPAGGIVQSVNFPRFGDDGSFRAFTVTLDATGRLRVTYKGALVLDVPNIGYTYAAGHRFTFSARTGGMVSEQRVDNIGIVTNPAGGAPDIGAVERDSAIPGFTPVVTSAMDTADGLDVNGVSLREAAAFAPAGGTITFAAGLNGGTITLGGSHIMLDKNVTLDATALAAGIGISGNANANGTLDAGESRIFDIPVGKTVLLRRLRLLNGIADPASGTNDAIGGAIRSSGQLTVERCTVSGCHAKFGGGLGILGGSATLTQSTLSGNSASNSGGGIYNINGGTLTLTQSTLSGNSTSSLGGGIYNVAGTLTLTQSTLSGNSTSGLGGGIYNGGGTLTLTHSIVAGNSAGNAASADISNLDTLTRVGANIVQSYSQEGGSFDSGPAAIAAAPLLAPLGDYGGPTPTMPPQPGSPAIDAAAGSTETLDQRGATRPQGSARDIGAVEFVPALVTNTLNSGSGSLRAAIALPFASAVTFAPGLSGQTITLNTGHLTLNRSLTVDATALPGGIPISGNSDGDHILESGESRIFDIPAGPTVLLRRLRLLNGIADPASLTTDSYGGGIRSEGQLTVEQCTVSGCRAKFGGGLGILGGSVALTQATLLGNAASDDGGGIINFGTLTLTQSTLSGNSASNKGGGIFNEGPLTLTQSTLSGNSASVNGGGISNIYYPLTLTHSIVAGNSASDGADILNFESHLFRSGANIVQSYVQVSEGTNSGPPAIAAAPLLAPLGDYGGPTRTMPPLPGSPAIDAAPASTETTDQRGLARPQGAARDIGAVEVFAGTGFVDTDSDGMDDRLEPLWDFIVGLPDGAGDADGDRSSNAAELGNMTSPRDPNSSLRIVAFTPAGFALDGDPLFAVTWTSFPGLSYTLQTKADLNFGVSPRQAGPFTATGLTHTLQIELDKINPKDFIRVRRN